MSDFEYVTKSLPEEEMVLMIAECAADLSRAAFKLYRTMNSPMSCKSDKAYVMEAIVSLNVVFDVFHNKQAEPPYSTDELRELSNHAMHTLAAQL